MSFEINWDVNKYKYHYELPHHWELKKKFMEFHKNKYPEDRLICLAQIFCNVHELGCRYGEEIMELIDNLTNGMFEKNAKFDTGSFSLASDAVEERVKAFTGQNKSSHPASERRSWEPIQFVKNTDGDAKWNSPAEDRFPSRKRPGEYIQSEKSSKMERLHVPNQSQNQREDTDIRPEERQLYSWEDKRAASAVKEVIESGPFGKVVVFRSSIHKDNATQIIERAASAAHMSSSYDYTENNGNYTCKFCLDGLYVSHGEGHTQKIAKEAACNLALERLQETSFTIEVKASYVGGGRVERDLNLDGKGTSTELPLADSNIGSKMMRMMGWTGGGLGKDQQGIEEPIKPYDQSVRRGGLGITNFSDFRRKVTRIIEEYAYSNDKNDLVFSPDFSKEERKTIHDLVRKYNLKSRSFGKNEDIRHIVVFRKIQPLEIVEDLLACGGETEKYKLIMPNPKVK